MKKHHFEYVDKLYIELDLIGDSCFSVADIYTRLYDEIFALCKDLKIKCFVQIRTNNFVELKPKDE